MAEVAATNPETPEVETEVTETEVEGVDLDAAETGESEQPPPEDDTEEIEVEGVKHKIPKALKGAFLMNADYTRKTQELATQRREYEDRVKQFGEQQKLAGEFIGDVGRVQAYDDAIKRFEALDWTTLWNQDRDSYHRLQFEFNRTKDERSKAFTALQTKVGERNSALQQEAAKQAEEFRAAVVREVPEMANPDFVGKLNNFAVAQGFTAQELSQVRDPRAVKILALAMKGSQIQTRQAVAKKAEAAQVAKPLPTVTGGSSSGHKVSPTDASSDKLSADEWLKRRNEQLRKRRA